MSNKFKDIDIKNHTYYFFGDIVNVKAFDLNKIKIDESHTKIFLFTILDMWKSKVQNFLKINSVNPLYLIINKVNGYFEEINKNKYLTVAATNESKQIIKKYEDLMRKTRDFNSSIFKNSDDYDEKCMKIKFNLDEKLPLNKTIEICSMIIVVRPVFHENNKLY